MRWFGKHAFACLWAVLLSLSLRAAEYKLIDGSSLTGEIISADKDGFLLKLEGGGYSPKTDWGKLSDEALVEMSKQPKARKFVEPYVVQPTEEEIHPNPKPLKLTEPTRVARPEVKRSVAGALFAPGGLFFLGLVYIANIFFAFQVARFRWRKPVLVCGLSAVLPVVGPLVFLAMPRWTPPEEIDATAEALQHTTLTVADSGPSLVQQMGLRAGGGEATGAAASGALPRTFGRGDFNFNRRFFETQFADFLPSASDAASAGLVIEIQTQAGNIVADKINRMNTSEVIVRVPGADETPVDFGAIVQITLRRKDG
ncbi:MAG: hypothetical protein DVB31_09405 [Verrucomicrobia bacterium]|nr:MAG: hypothetical protein DVB31_09405 [Verrucomicrobiota bacterium]